MKHYKEFLKGLEQLDDQLEKMKKRAIKRTVEVSDGIFIGFILFMVMTIGLEIADEKALMYKQGEAAIECPASFNIEEEVKQLQIKEQALQDALEVAQLIQEPTEDLERLMDDFLSSYEKIETNKQINAKLTYLDRLKCRQLNSEK